MARRRSNGCGGRFRALGVGSLATIFWRGCAHAATLTAQAIPEGRVVHAHVPLTVVRGPLAMAQILETPLLNILNYQTLIATKAAACARAPGTRLSWSVARARARPRRQRRCAGGSDRRRGLLLGTRASPICWAIRPKARTPTRWCRRFWRWARTELDAFQAYADLYPDECLLLVDTIDTLESGVPNAIRVFERLRKKATHRWACAWTPAIWAA